MLYKSAARAGMARFEYSQPDNSPEHPWHGARSIAPQQFSLALAQVFINEIIRPDPEHRWIGFKEIRYDQLGDEFVPFLDWMYQTFPNPFFLFNTRHHEDVVKSGWHVKENRSNLIEVLEKMDKRFEHYSRKRPDRCFVNSYAELTKDPKSIEPFFNMIGVRFDHQKIMQVMQKKLSH